MLYTVVCMGIENDVVYRSMYGYRKSYAVLLLCETYRLKVQLQYLH